MELRSLLRRSCNEMAQEARYSLVSRTRWSSVGCSSSEPEFAEPLSPHRGPWSAGIRGLTSEQILNNNIVPRSELDVQDDYILSQSGYCSCCCRSLMATYSNRIKSNGKGLGSHAQSPSGGTAPSVQHAVSSSL